MTEMVNSRELGRRHRADYGIDAPPVIRNFFLAGIGCFFLAWCFPDFVSTLVFPGVAFCVSGLLMIVYSKTGKFRHRNRLLNLVAWRGDERVLDVGTGRGLLMIGAAKRLTTGKSHGIDVWSAKDLSGNVAENTLLNAALEGVADRVMLHNEPAEKTSFPEGHFDYVFSNLCLHNIPTPVGRRKACLEIARVLKPGGTAIISDFQKTKEYQGFFKEAGLTTALLGPFVIDTFPPLTIVRAEKPAGKS